MLSILSDTEKAVVQTMTMKLLPTPAVQYLKDVGFRMSRATYFRYKKRVEGLKFERLKFISEHFQDQHLEKLDKLELIENLMWENYHKETNPTKRVKILESIVNTQPYLSSYYEATTALYLNPAITMVTIITIRIIILQSLTNGSVKMKVRE